MREATKEMFMPIMSSTIVTIAVFLPLALVGGQIGELFMPFALTIVFALEVGQYPRLVFFRLYRRACQ